MQQVTNYTNEIVALQAITDEHFFNNFKRDRRFIEILEHVSHQQGIQYINYIQILTSERLLWSKFMENDNYGNPNKSDFYDHLKNIADLSSYNFSPTTLRYVCFGLQIFNYIESMNVKELSIIEVGCGYGGQCKILFDICSQFGIKINKYTLIDLENVSKLQRKYLDKFNLQNIVTLPYNDCLDKLDGKYDLFISNYALGEFTTDVQNFYIDNVLNRCDKYFITWNTFPINSKLSNYKSVEEFPQTGHKEFPNVILTN